MTTLWRKTDTSGQLALTESPGWLRWAHGSRGTSGTRRNSGRAFALCHGEVADEDRVDAARRSDHPSHLSSRVGMQAPNHEISSRRRETRTAVQAAAST